MCSQGRERWFMGISIWFTHSPLQQWLSMLDAHQNHVWHLIKMESCADPSPGDCDWVGPRGNQALVKNRKENLSARTPSWRCKALQGKCLWVITSANLISKKWDGVETSDREAYKFIWGVHTKPVSSKRHERNKPRFQVTLPFEHFSMSSEDCNHNGTRVSPPQENDKWLPVWNEFCFDKLLRCSTNIKKHIINENRAQSEHIRVEE